MRRFPDCFPENPQFTVTDGWYDGGSTFSRMTISVESDDITFEQDVEKQLNRMVEVIKVMD